MLSAAQQNVLHYGAAKVLHHSFLFQSTCCAVSTSFQLRGHLPIPNWLLKKAQPRLAHRYPKNSLMDPSRQSPRHHPPRSKSKRHIPHSRAQADLYKHPDEPGDLHVPEASHLVPALCFFRPRSSLV